MPRGTRKIEKLEEDYKMPYVTSWERIAKKEGKAIFACPRFYLELAHREMIEAEKFFLPVN